MNSVRIAVRRGLLAIVIAASLAGPPAAADAASGSGLAGTPGTQPSGGAPLSGPPKPHHRRPPPSAPRTGGRWLGGVTVTEYWPAPERWFVGSLVSAPGLAGKHRIDWLYSATGVSMQGEGIGLDGHVYHLDAAGSGGWVTAAGQPTSATSGFAGGPPYWRAGAFWRNRAGAVTFPLAAGGWSAGVGIAYVPLAGVTFAPGASLPLRYYRSIAVDPNVIPLGSRVYVPAYRNDGHGGWFTAQDTGGAITGRHIDVYRRPPASPGTSGRHLTGQRVYVVKPSR